MRIILTGASGLIGSRFEELMFENHEIIPLSVADGVNITDKSSVERFFQDKNADVLIHLAAKTDVDGCEVERDDAFAVNVVGTKNLYDTARKKGIKFVYISTDFVFSGEDESYTEESIPDPVDWYGQTKWLGEKEVDASDNLIVSLSFPYGHLSPVKKDFVWKIHDLLAGRDEVGLISDQTITPTFIDDIVEGLDFLLQKNVAGIYHLTGSSYHSPFEIGQKIKNLFGLKTKINEARLEEIYKGKAPRPFKSIMRNAKIMKLGFKPKTLDKGLELIKV